MLADIAHVGLRVTTPCVEWEGAKNRKGYGQSKVNGKLLIVHRAVWEALVGPIPEGMLVLHRCDNPSCYRLDHLFVGTHQDNALDRVAKGRDFNARKTHCHRGHPLDGENTYTHNSKRLCKECRREAVRQMRRRRG